MSGETRRITVRTALEQGYRHADTARLYRNEAAVGRAIVDSAVPREAVFVVTKFRGDDLTRSGR